MGHKKIIQPMIDELNEQTKPKEPEPETAPEQPAELDQDSGGGYNPDGTYPQT
jgi:hypothetical protein